MEEKNILKLKQLTMKQKNSIDIPVACVITCNNKIVASSTNDKYKKNNPLGHAEINAILKTCKKLKRTNLLDCTLYTTLYPCEMCSALINEVRIKNVKYIVKNIKKNNNTIKYEQVFKKENDFFSRKITDFFSKKRNNNDII